MRIFYRQIVRSHESLQVILVLRCAFLHYRGLLFNVHSFPGHLLKMSMLRPIPEPRSQHLRHELRNLPHHRLSRGFWCISTFGKHCSISCFVNLGRTLPFKGQACSLWGLSSLGKEQLYYRIKDFTSSSLLFRWCCAEMNSLKIEEWPKYNKNPAISLHESDLSLKKKNTLTVLQEPGLTAPSIILGINKQTFPSILATSRGKQGRNVHKGSAATRGASPN